MAEAKTKTISSTEFQRNIGAVIDQVRNGVAVRMAVLSALLEKSAA